MSSLLGGGHTEATHTDATSVDGSDEEFVLQELPDTDSELGEDGEDAEYSVSGLADAPYCADTATQSDLPPNSATTAATQQQVRVHTKAFLAIAAPLCTASPLTHTCTPAGRSAAWGRHGRAGVAQAPARASRRRL